MINQDMKSLFLAYLDNELSVEEKAQFEEYLANDPAAKTECESMQNIMACFRELPDQPLPDGFSDLIHDRLTDEKNAHPYPKRFLNNSWWKPLAAVAVLMFFVAVANSGIFNAAMTSDNADTDMNQIAGGSSAEFGTDEAASSPDMGIADQEAPLDDFAKSASRDHSASTSVSNAGITVDSAADMTTGNGGSALGVDSLENAVLSGDAATTERKVIKNSNISLETDDYNTAFESISAIAAAYGGYVVSGYTNNNDSGEPDSGYLSIRVVSTSMDAALAEIRALGDIRNEDFSGEDVTSQYIDVESRLKQYRIQEESLLTLFNKATTVTDMISIESELARVRGEIESLEGQIRYLTQVTDLSLINVNITVPAHLSSGGVDYSDWHNFWQKLGASFISGLAFITSLAANAIFALGYLLPVLLILAIILVIVWMNIKRFKKKKTGNKE